MLDTVSKYGDKVTYASSSITMLMAGFTLEHCAIIVGIICTIVVAGVTCYCKFRWLKTMEEMARKDKVTIVSD